MRKMLIGMTAALAMLATVCLPAQTTAGGQNDIRVGVSIVHSTRVETGLSFDNETGTTLEYDHYFSDRWALGLSYLNFHQRMTETPFLWYFQPDTYDTAIDSLTVEFQCHFAGRKIIDPYLGLGLNLLYCRGDGDFVMLYTGRQGEYYAFKAGAELGFALDAGVKFRLDNRLFLALDARYMGNGIRAVHWEGYGRSAQTVTGASINPVVTTFALGFTW